MKDSTRPAFVAGSVPFHFSTSTTRTCKLPSSGLHSICSTPVRQESQIRKSPVNRANVSMGLFGLGFPELLVIAGVGILIFGPNKIAEFGKDLGGIAGGVKKASAEFKDAMQDSLEEADKEIEKKKMEKEIDVVATPVKEEATKWEVAIPVEVEATESKVATPVKEEATESKEVKDSS